jgi:DNA repair protein RecN (Recombination protein N)
MLRYLNIRNLAVIEALEVSFEPGLNVLTGETGAGKSILVEAVSLLLGGRASPELVRTGEETAIIQAIFETDGREVVVRREISASGRSRAFIDGTLATSGALRELGDGLVDLHGQHEHQALLNPEGHIDLLDQYAGQAGQRDLVSAAYAEWARLTAELDEVRRQERDKSARTDFLRFQLGEIDRARPRSGEDEELAAARQLLANAEKLKRLCDEAYSRLYESDDAVLGGLVQVWKRVGDLAALDARFTPYVETRDAVRAQLEDLAAFLREYAADIDSAPGRLQEVEDRLAALERLKRKYGPTLADVLGRASDCRAELETLQATGERAAELERAVAAAAGSYSSRAAILSAARREAAPRFARALEQGLAELAMERTRLEVRFGTNGDEPGKWTARGVDVAEFYVSPNPGEELRPLARIVSGGELSRLMLGLKTLASTDAPGKTLIFDEVDAGIGGRVADVVGRRLQGLGQRFQVLCITHLPHIASCATTHFRVTKSVRNNRTLTSVDRLEGETRVEEVARMMAGAVVTESTLSGAREMVASRQAKGEQKTKGESERRKRK